MDFQIHNTRDHSSSGLNAVIYGYASAGKTHLVRTLEAPFVFSCDTGGTKTLKDTDIAYTQISTMEQIRGIVPWVRENPNARHFKSIVIDTISHLAEIALRDEVKKNGNPQGRAYGVITDLVGDIVRDLCRIDGINAIFLAKVDITSDHEKRQFFGPGLPGQKAGRDLTYDVDMVAAMRQIEHEGEMHRVLMLETDGMWSAKHRFGSALQKWEAPDLGAIIRKAGV